MRLPSTGLRLRYVSCLISLLLEKARAMDYLSVVYALLTGLFWGTYGPTLQNARVPGKSPFAPYVMIGVAYLIWGILGGLGGMISTQKPGEALLSFKRNELVWGFAAGSLGAFGALTLTLAVVASHGKPHLVMPIVFGTAVTVSAITSVIKTGAVAETSPMLWAGIAGMVVCIVTVAYFTPHSAPHAAKPAGASPASATTPEATSQSPGK